MKVVNYKNLPHQGYLLAPFHGLGPFVSSVGNLSIKGKVPRDDCTVAPNKAIWFPTKKLANKYCLLYEHNSALDLGIIDLGDQSQYSRVYKVLKGSND